MPTMIKTKIKRIKKNSKYIILSAAVTLCLVMLIMYPKTVSSGIKNGINCCLDVLIPSMFPFMVLASAVTLSGIDEKFKFIFGKSAKLLFYLPACTVPAIIMSLFGGYPIGAYCVKSLYKSGSINEEQLNRMMYFCVNFGPAFIISALGQMLLNNHKLGVILFLIQSGSSVLIGIISGAIVRVKGVRFYNKKTYLQKKSFLPGKVLINACESASKSLLNVCSLVTLFFGIISLIGDLGVVNYISSILLRINIPQHISNTLILSIIEMTQSCIISAKNIATPYYIYSWVLGFGGICAHTQIIAQFKGCPFKYGKFLIMRIVNGILTAITTFIIFKNSEKTLQTFSPLTVNRATEISKASPTHLGSIVLIFFCVFFTLSVNSFKNIRKYNKKASAKNCADT